MSMLFCFIPLSMSIILIFRLSPLCSINSVSSSPSICIYWSYCLVFGLLVFRSIWQFLIVRPSLRLWHPVKQYLYESKTYYGEGWDRLLRSYSGHFSMSFEEQWDVLAGAIPEQLVLQVRTISISPSHCQHPGCDHVSLTHAHTPATTTPVVAAWSRAWHCQFTWLPLLRYPKQLSHFFS